MDTFKRVYSDDDMSDIEIQDQIEAYGVERQQAMKVGSALAEFLVHAVDIQAPKLKAACEAALDMALALAGDRASRMTRLRGALFARKNGNGGEQ